MQGFLRKAGWTTFVAFLFLLLFPALASADPHHSEPPSRGEDLKGTVWKTHEIWVSDQVRSQGWPVEEALDIWNGNGTITFRYSALSCDKLPAPCVPVVTDEPEPGSNTIAYVSLNYSGGYFNAAQVTLLIDRGAGLNKCTLLHEFGHVIADIPHDWTLEDVPATSVMNASCDRQVENQEPITLPEEDKWYVQGIYRKAALTEDVATIEKRLVDKAEATQAAHDKKIYAEAIARNEQRRLVGIGLMVSIVSVTLMVALTSYEWAKRRSERAAGLLLTAG